MSFEEAIEQRLRSKTAPRLTPHDINKVIVGKTFTILPSGKCTVCELTLENGFTIRGESSCVSKENFDIKIGEDISFENARNKIWELEGYLLQERIKS